MSQTKRQYMTKVRELLRTQNRTIVKRAEALWRSGAIEPSEFEDDYILPKAVVCVLDREAAESWRPMSPAHRSLVRNLEHF